MKTGYKVQDVMTNMPVKVEKTAGLRETAELMVKFNVNSVLVMENDKLVGIVTDEDFVRKLVAVKSHAIEGKISEIMSSSLLTISPEKDLYDAILLMRDNSIRQLPVMVEENLVGFLSMNDILKIQPELFDIVAESISLREQERKFKNIEGLEEEEI